MYRMMMREVSDAELAEDFAFGLHVVLDGKRIPPEDLWKGPNDE
jgi:hypothetical protein